ncbi:MAG: GNAT family N-acetyltransferase [Syntrophobacterales bacterium]|nr:GNAT family N-acetyltransferase [Syntrophobacterales bacterium]
MNLKEGSFRFLDSSRFEATASLFNEVFSKSAKPSDFEWKYREGLFGRLYGVQVEDERNNVISHVAAIPLEGFFAGERIPFFQFVDAMVHPSWRGQNILTAMIHMLLRFICNHHPVFFPYVFPGPVSSKIGQKYGWLGLLGSIEDVSIGRLDQRAFPRWLRLISFEKLSPNFSEDVMDSLWARSRKYYPVLITRDSTFLKWRYLSHPWFSYDFYLVKRLWKPIGWIILETRDSSPPRIVDYLLPPFSMREVFSCFLRELAIHEAILWVPGFLRKEFLDLKRAYYPTPIDLAIVVNDSVPFLPPLEILSSCFFYTMGDIDIY